MKVCLCVCMGVCVLCVCVCRWMLCAGEWVAPWVGGWMDETECSGRR